MLEYVSYTVREPKIPEGGITAMSDADLNELITFRFRARNDAEDSLQRAAIEQANRGLR